MLLKKLDVKALLYLFMQFSVVHICFFYSEVATLNSFVKCYPLLHDYKWGLRRLLAKLLLLSVQNQQFTAYPHMNMLIKWHSAFFISKGIDIPQSFFQLYFFYWEYKVHPDYLDQYSTVFGKSGPFLGISKNRRLQSRWFWDSWKHVTMLANLPQCFSPSSVWMQSEPTSWKEPYKYRTSCHEIELQTWPQ